MTDEPPSIHLRDVSKSYEEAGHQHAVLRGVSMDLAAGESAAILGRSGSGKSTLLNIVAGIDAPDEGEVVVAGVPVPRLSERERTLFRRGAIGFVYQFFNLIPTLTVLENVQLPLDLLDRADGAQAALAMLDSVGLANRAGAFPDQLSGGEQQRVAIARALAANPPIVLADEPTGNLDADTGDRVLDLLLSLTRGHGRSLLVATHSRSVAAATDVVLRMEEGHLVPGLVAGVVEAGKAG